jgi:hypothetical protein
MRRALSAAMTAVDKILATLPLIVLRFIASRHGFICGSAVQEGFHRVEHQAWPIWQALS